MKTEELSEAQRALIPQVRAEWLKIALDTAPVDRARVREILGRLYGLANKPAPNHILHFESPLQISIAIAELRMADEPIRSQVAAGVDSEVHQQVFKQAAERVTGQVTDSFNGKVGLKLTASALDPDLQVIGPLLDQASGGCRDKFSGFRASLLENHFGQFDPSLAWWDFIGRLGFDVSQLVPAFDLARSAGWSVLFWDWAFVSAKPECIHRDELQRLHCETGAAVRYPNGFSVFAIHGVRVPETVVAAPESLTVREIESETNAEVRRVMIERYGPQRYLMDSRAEEIHRDDFGILFRKSSLVDEPLVMVKVVNSTPEPDGSFKDYFLRVPPTMTRARQAVAWTFGKAESDYAPACQT